MGAGKEPPRDGQKPGYKRRHLAKAVNRAAESFDVSALSTEEAVEVYTLLDRLTQKLWNEHKRVLVSLYQSILERRGLSQDDEDDEDDDDEPEDTGGGSH